jgi:hypothetical protein
MERDYNKFEQIIYNIPVIIKLGIEYITLKIENIRLKHSIKKLEKKLFITEEYK